MCSGTRNRAYPTHPWKSPAGCTTYESITGKPRNSQVLLFPKKSNSTNDRVRIIEMRPLLAFLASGRPRDRADQMKGVARQRDLLEKGGGGVQCNSFCNSQLRQLLSGDATRSADWGYVRSQIREAMSRLTYPLTPAGLAVPVLVGFDGKPLKAFPASPAEETSMKKQAKK